MITLKLVKFFKFWKKYCVLETPHELLSFAMAVPSHSVLSKSADKSVDTVNPETVTGLWSAAGDRKCLNSGNTISFL
jgi:hypothetical protein